MALARPTLLAMLLSALTLALAPAAAFADGDPASDVLLNADAFYPYQPVVASDLAQALNETIKRAHGAGFPVKVALIEAPTDLGAVPDLFGKPQKYSDFLDREISFNKQAQLLVVMPQGFGVTAAGSAATLAGITVGGGGSDALARAAIPAVAALARAAGHPFTPPPVPAGGGSSSGGTPALLTFGAPVALVLLVALGTRFIRRRQEEDAA
jgi:hypothetical protein